MSKNARSPTSVGDLLAGSEVLRAKMAHIGLADWQRAVGERLARKTRPERLDDGILTVRVPSSTWAQELSLLSDMVIERLRGAGHGVERLRFRVHGAVEPEPPVTLVRRTELPGPLVRAIAKVDDPALRELISAAASYTSTRGGSRGPD